MSKGNVQYVAVTKQRKKSGCLGIAGHGCMTVFTAGLWIPIWGIKALFNLRKRTVAVTHYYGPEGQQPPPGFYPPQGTGAPNYPPHPQYGPPGSYPAGPQSPQAWQQPLPYRANPPSEPQRPTYSVGQPPAAETPPPEDPWDTGSMRRRS